MNYILIVEDDTALSNGIVLALKDDHCTFVQAYYFVCNDRQAKHRGAAPGGGIVS